MICRQFCLFWIVYYLPLSFLAVYPRAAARDQWVEVGLGQDSFAFVAVDQEGTVIEGHVPAANMDKFKNVLKEGLVYTIEDFMVKPARDVYRTVDRQHRIALVQHTKVKETIPQPNNIPLVACDLHPISTVEKRFRKTVVLSDAIGLLLELTGSIYPTGDGDPRRNLKMKDINGNDIGITLWGHQAESFDEEAIHSASAQGNVVVLFVSMNVDYFSGSLCFKGTSLTRSYINPPIPAMSALRARYGNEPNQVQWRDVGEATILYGEQQESAQKKSAEAAAELARDFAPDIECKWGDAGLEEIIGERSIMGVAVVLAGQVQVELSLKMLKAGKHVIQEKPASGSTTEAETALSVYNSFPNQLPYKPIWALAENYRFEPAFVESNKLMSDIGEMMNIQVIVEGSMNSSNPYFNSSWRRNFLGGFILDMGVHFIAGLRMLVGSEIATVSSISRHVDTALPPPDNICSLFQLENGCAGVLVFAVNSRSPKILWRVDGTKGTVQVERGIDGGKHGYQVLFTSENGQCQKTFYPFSGVHEELKAFVHDMVQASKDGDHKAEPRSSYVEGARDVAVLEAMLESSTKQGAQVQVKRF